jgi:hypothetical protein
VSGLLDYVAHIVTELVTHNTNWESESL